MQLKVISYNIQGHAAGRRADHIPKIAETIAALEPDVVGLQEVHCRTRASQLHDQAETIAVQFIPQGAARRTDAPTEPSNCHV